MLKKLNGTKNKEERKKEEKKKNKRKGRKLVLFCDDQNNGYTASRGSAKRERRASGDLEQILTGAHAPETTQIGLQRS